jgi:phosphatidylglycerophosphate synthase
MGTTPVERTADGRVHERDGASLLPDLTAGGILVLLTALGTWRALDLPATHPALSMGLYGLLAACLLSARPLLPGRSGLGLANRITLLRAGLILPVAALVPFFGALGARGAWWIIALSTVALILDGVDGRLARQTDTHSEFGARFDMEVDAFLLLALSLLVWLLTPVGPWVLLIGGIRYLFVAAGWMLPALSESLEPSKRRQTVCVLQGVGLLVCLGPIVPGWLAQVVAALVLGALLYSFGVDTLDLLNRERAVR